MKKVLSLFFFIINIFCFGSVNDSLNLLNENDKKLIEEKIEEIKNTRKISSYVNTMQLGEGFKVTDPERTFILNLKKDGKMVDVELSFSKDIPVEEKQEEINKILDSASDILEEKEYKKYIITILDGISISLQDVEIDDDKPYSMTKQQEDDGNKNVLKSVYIILFICAIIGSVEILKRRKQSDSDNENSENN